MKDFTCSRSTRFSQRCWWPSLISCKKILKTGVGSLFPLLLFLLFTGTMATAQVDIPLTNEVKANFGIEADLYANVLDNETQPGDPDFSNTDDWFLNSELWPGSGLGVINVTEGDAPAKIAAWAGDVNANISDTLRQSLPIYSMVDGRTWIDALYARDQRTNGKLQDNSYFTSGDDKNFHDPETWTIGIGSGGPQKNDIIEFVGHIRRDIESTPGPEPGLGTEYAFLGATTRSQDGTSHLDFELFRNEIVREGSKLVSSGPDCNRTAYEFDGDGNVTTHGDLIFSINYTKGGDNVKVELFIWIDRQDFPNDQAFRDFNALSDNPFNFGSASGAFNFYECNEDPRYGYAQVKLATAEAQGWVTAQINQIETLGPSWGTYSGNGQQVDDLPVLSFIELSINATKLGLDTGSTGGTCEKPLGTVLVKSRSSASFTAELKDMLGPFPFGATPPVDVEMDNEQLNCTLEFVTLEAKLQTAGDFKFKWFAKNDQGDYEEIIGEIGSTYDATEPGFYKVMVTQVLSNGGDGCTDEAEAEVTGTNDAPTLETTCPDSISVDCEDDISTEFTNWLNTFDVTGGGGTVTATYTVTIDDGDESAAIDFANWPQGIIEPADVCGGGSITINLSASDECDQSPFCESTFTLNPITPGLNLPPNGSDTVSCPGDATDPGAPDTIQDACGNDIVPELVGQDDPSPECEGDVVWRYRYNECDGTTSDWTYTYTIDYSGGLTAPTDVVVNVQCPEDVVMPAAPGSILDACNRKVEPVFSGREGNPDDIVCKGTVIYTWTYTACDGETTDTYTYTYNVEDTEDPLIEIPQVEDVCEDDVPASLTAYWTDNCADGGSLDASPVLVGSDECSNTYRYTWTVADDCGNTDTAYVDIVQEFDVVGNCETIFGYADDDVSRCFLEDDFSRWGWTNHLTSEDSYELTLYAGAGQCDRTKGAIAGTATIDYSGGEVTVTYLMDGYTLSEAHVYIGCEPYPVKNGNPTVAPGQYNFNPSFSGNVQAYQVGPIDVSDLDEVYVIVHGVACEVICQCTNDLEPGGDIPGAFDGSTATCTESATASNGNGNGNGKKNKSAESSSFKASPVPFNERLTIQYDFEYTSNVDIQIFDLKGQLLRTYNDKRVTKGDTKELDVDFALKANQMYIIRIVTDREVLSKNVISSSRK